MDKKCIVIYHSKRGTTKQYAEWIAEDLGCEMVALEDFDLANVVLYDVVIFGSWLRGSGIVNWDKVANYLEDQRDRTIIFTTGISDYNPDNYMQICEINFDGLDNMEKTKLFYCPGAYDPSKVKGVERLLMKVAKSVLKGGKTPDGASAADHMIDAIDHGADHVDRRYVTPIVNAAKAMLE